MKVQQTDPGLVVVEFFHIFCSVDALQPSISCGMLLGEVVVDFTMGTWAPWHAAPLTIVHTDV